MQFAIIFMTGCLGVLRCDTAIAETSARRHVNADPTTTTIASPAVNWILNLTEIGELPPMLTCFCNDEWNALYDEHSSSMYSDACYVDHVDEQQGRRPICLLVNSTYNMIDTGRLKYQYLHGCGFSHGYDQDICYTGKEDFHSEVENLTFIATQCGSNKCNKFEQWNELCDSRTSGTPVPTPEVSSQKVQSDVLMVDVNLDIVSH